LKVSIITVVHNGRSTIEDAILSVISQTHSNKEHIIIDGGSTDGTLGLIKKYRDRLAHVISEHDRGIYDAMNKGVKLADGNIIGFLNSDDVYSHNRVLSDVVYSMERNNLDCVFGDLAYVHPNNPNRIIRYYSSKDFKPSKLTIGCMPAHPTLFFKKYIYKKYGLFKIDYQIAGDFEYVARVFTKGAIRFAYIPKVMVKMKIGGASTKSLRSNWILNREILRACRENGISTNIYKLFSKYPEKILGLIKKPVYYS
jgi:glycosyltransferase involved in cell wall biosynthesis